MQFSPVGTNTGGVVFDQLTRSMDRLKTDIGGLERSHTRGGVDESFNLGVAALLDDTHAAQSLQRVLTGMSVGPNGDPSDIGPMYQRSTWALDQVENVLQGVRLLDDAGLAAAKDIATGTLEGALELMRPRVSEAPVEVR